MLEKSPGELGLCCTEVMRVRFLFTLGRRSGEEFFADNCSQMAAAVSYYVLFSLFPLLIFLIGVLGLSCLSGQGASRRVRAKADEEPGYTYLRLRRIRVADSVLLNLGRPAEDRRSR